MKRLRLRSDVQVVVEYADNTPFGSALGRRADDQTLAAFAPLVDHIRAHGTADLAQAAPALLQASVESEAFARVTEPDGLGAWRIHPDMLYPQVTQATPKALWLERPDTGGKLRANLPATHWRLAHELVASLTAVHPDMQSLLEVMRREDLVEEIEADAPPPE